MPLPPRTRVSIIARLHVQHADICVAKKTAKRLEKEAKLAMKSVKTASGASTPAGEKKAKVEKKKVEEEVPFVNTTPKGEKKGANGTKCGVACQLICSYFRPVRPDVFHGVQPDCR